MTPSENPLGLIFVMIGPGGAGKNAIMKAIIAQSSHIRQLATATTRIMRANEQQGREHFFVTPAQFQDMIKNDLLLEYQEVTPNKLYGIPRQGVVDCLSGGKICVADIDVLGAKALVAAFPNHVVQIFVTVPGASIAEQLTLLEQRMRNRRDSTTDIAQRLKRARSLELPYQNDCDYIVVNDTLEQAVQSTRAIIQSELRQRCLVGEFS